MNSHDLVGRHASHKKQYILSGYRQPGMTLAQCVTSVFSVNNETINFWTHFVPFWYILWVLKGLLENTYCFHDAYSWPILSYVCACAVYLLASSVAHLFSAVSESVANICFLLDYGAISLYALNAGLAYRAYAFPVELRRTTFGTVYVEIGAVMAVLGMFTACYTRYRHDTTFVRLIRTGSFALPCLYAVGPIVYRFTFGKDLLISPTSSSQWNHWLGIVFMVLSGILYSGRMPERFWPGCFDIVGHSHQLFHITTFAGTAFQMSGILTDMGERRTALESEWEFKLFNQSFGLAIVVLVINVLLAIFFWFKFGSTRTDVSKAD